MIQQIALIEHRNPEVVQKYIEIEYQIKAICFRFTKNGELFQSLKNK